MIDIGRIQIPFHAHHVIDWVDKETGKLTGGEIDVRILSDYGFHLGAGLVDIGSDGNLSVSSLYHPFESLPSSNSSLAFKVRSGGKNYWPFVELNASPAKLLQAHNAFGSDDFELCLSSLLYVFACQFPNIHELLDFKHAEVSQMDFTYSAFTKNIFEAKQVIEALRHVSSGQVRQSRESYKTSVMWNAGSSHCVREVYLKHYEIMRQIEELTSKQKKSPADYQAKQLEVLQSKIVQDYAKNAVRFEAKVKKRMFKRLGIPTQIIKLIEYSQNFNGNLAQYLWEESFKEIFSTFEGADVNIYDDNDVLEKLKSEYFTINSKGVVKYTKALRLFRFFRSIKSEGFEQVKSTTPESTFFRQMSELTTVIPKSYLQNLHAVKSNVIPLVKIINVDFSKQYPKGYKEPLHMSVQLGEKTPLRLVG